MTRPEARPAAGAGTGSAAPASERDIPEVGNETGMRLPRFVSLKADEANVRRGPGQSNRIDWVYVRRGMPLRVTAEFGHWRRVEDSDGMGGWVHYALLSGTRTALTTGPITPLRSHPAATATEVAALEEGVIARIDECVPDWCRISVAGYRGWADKTQLWGVDADEVFD